MKRAVARPAILIPALLSAIYRAPKKVSATLIFHNAYPGHMAREIALPPGGKRSRHLREFHERTKTPLRNISPTAHKQDCEVCAGKDRWSLLISILSIKIQNEYSSIHLIRNHPGTYRILRFQFAHLVIFPVWRDGKFSLNCFDFDVLVQSHVVRCTRFWKDLILIYQGSSAGHLHRPDFSSPSARLGWLIIRKALAGLFGL